MLFAIAGMMLMATASDLLVIFLALEVLSLAVYVLTGIRRDSPAATEAAFKYFLLGAFSSAFFLYGIAFTYGVTGSTRLDRIGSLIAAQAMAPTPMQLLALGLLLVGLRVQGVGRAVPHVDARRLRRRADRRHRLHVDRRQGGGVRRVRARVPLGVRAAARRMERARLGDRRGDDDRRDRGRRRADERQADARLLEHRARRLPAGRARVGERRRQGRDPLLPAGLRRHQPRRVRRRSRCSRTPIGRTIASRDYAGLWTDAPGAGGADDGVPAVARRLPAARRVHRQVVRVQRRDRGRLLLAGDHRRADERRLGVLLPAHRRDDVHDAGATTRLASRRCRGSPAPRLSSRRSSSSTSASCRAVSSTWAARRSRRSSEHSEGLRPRTP